MAILIKCISFTLYLMPRECLEILISLLSSIFINKPSKRRRVLLSNLSHAFPQWSLSRVKETGRDSTLRMLEMGFFSLLYPHMTSDERKRTVFFPKATERKLQEIRKSNAPALFLLPHVSLFETLATTPYFRPFGNKSLGAIYRPNRNQKLDDWIRNARVSTGLKVFSRKAGLKEALYFLKRGNWLTVLFDQNGGQSGADSIFLNRLSSQTTLPDILSKVKDLRIIYAMPTRVSFFKTRLSLKEIEICENRSVSQKAHDLLAEDIMSCPKGLPDWLWAHGKWKVHYYPNVRFQLNEKRSFLTKNESTRTGTRMVIRLPNWLGDVVMSLPIIRALRKARPDMQFLIVARSIYLPLVKEFKLGEEFIPADSKSFIKQIRVLLKVRSKFPDCHLLFTNSLRGDIESLLIGSPQRLGLEFSNRKRLLLTNFYKVNKKAFNSKHLTKTWEDMIKEFGFLGKVSFEPFHLTTLREAKKDQFKIGIALGSSNNPSKQWPINYWIDLIRLLKKHYPRFEIYLFGMPSDIENSSLIIEKSNNVRIVNLVGKTSLCELAQEFSNCTALIGCDSGAVHLASAVGVRTLTIFGPTNKTVTSPCFDTKRIEFLNESRAPMVDCSPSDVLSYFNKLINMF